MGKNNRRQRESPADESYLLLPNHFTTSGLTPIVDTHTHIYSTYAMYRQKYRNPQYADLFSFVRAMCERRNVEAVVDVWCEAPVQKVWKELADSALTQESRKEKWGGIEYWFVMGVHPHDAKMYSDAVENDILEAMAHPRCVGWGEIGLDYHYDNSPREIQKNVLRRQLQQAVKLGKPITIHTREAEEDMELILKAEVPKEHKIHVHCYTDSPDWADRMMQHFPNLHIGITGVITYSSNVNTSDVIRRMIPTSTLRMVLETDAPYMVPGNIYSSLGGMRGKLPLCHSAMIPWTADFVANVAGDGWNSEQVMKVSRENARKVYGV